MEYETSREVCCGLVATCSTEVHPHDYLLIFYGVYLHELHGHQLESLLLKSLDNVPDQPPLYPVRFHHDVRPLHLQLR